MPDIPYPLALQQVELLYFVLLYYLHRELFPAALLLHQHHASERSFAQVTQVLELLRAPLLRLLSSARVCSRFCRRKRVFGAGDLLSGVVLWAEECAVWERSALLKVRGDCGVVAADPFDSSVAYFGFFFTAAGDAHVIFNSLSKEVFEL